MDSDIKKYILSYVMQDEELKQFAITHLDNKSQLTLEEYTEYIRQLIIDFEGKFTETDIKEVRKFLLTRIRQTRRRLNKENKFEGRLINYPDIDNLRYNRVKPIIDNEILLLITTAIEQFEKQCNDIVERPMSLEGMYYSSQKLALYNVSNKITIGNETAFVSDNSFKRSAGIVQPVLYSSNPVETLFVTKNDKIYCKSKTLDAIDQKIMDFLTEEYKKNMYFTDYSIDVSLNKLCKIAYNVTSHARIDWIVQRLDKMAAQGFRIYEENSKTIDDYKLVKLFEIEYYTDEAGIRSCRIDLSSSIKRDIKNRNTIKLYKNKINKIKDDFTAIFVTYLQNQRITFAINDIYKMKFPYNVIKSNVMLPYTRSKTKNLKAIEKSLEQLKDMNFIIKNFKIRNDSVYIEFNKLEYFELKNLKLVDKAKQYEVY